MITVNIDENTRAGKRILNEIKKCRTGVEIKSPAVNGVPPEGYMTSEDFWTEMELSYKEILKKYGVLQPEGF